MKRAAAVQRWDGSRACSAGHSCCEQRRKLCSIRPLHDTAPHGTVPGPLAGWLASTAWQASGRRVASIASIRPSSRSMTSAPVASAAQTLWRTMCATP